MPRPSNPGLGRLSKKRCREAPLPYLHGRLYRRLAIVVLALSAYWPTLRMGFLWDDHVMIEANPSLRHWSSPTSNRIFTPDPFNGHGDPYYRPLQTLANRCDYTLWGLHPFGYHLTNLAFHAGQRRPGRRTRHRARLWPACGAPAGCLFAVHPIVVEQLMIIAGRAELMTLLSSFWSTCFFFFRRRPRVGRGGGRLCAARSCRKESAIITPAFFCFLAGSGRKNGRLIASMVHVLAVTVALSRASFSCGRVARLPVIPSLYGRRAFRVQAFPRIMAPYARL